MPLIITRGAASAKGFGFAGFVGKAPGAPTIGTATAGNALACVAFTAPSCTGIPPGITGYQATCVATGTHTATGSSSPIQITGLTNCTAYTFKVRATNSVGYGAYSGNSNSVTPVVKGSQLYTTPGTFTWVAPAGVTKISIVAVGGGSGSGNCGGCCCGNPFGGGGGAGGGLGYKNNYAVTPGSSYCITVGAGGGGCRSGGCSYFANTGIVKGGGGQGECGGNHGGCGGGNGGSGNGNYYNRTSGGGGAGGYSGTGGAGGYGCTNSTSGSGGGGAGGQRAISACLGAGGGGGVGFYGQGSSGIANSRVGSGGAGGSSGGSGVCSLGNKGGSGGNYGGGAGGSGRGGGTTQHGGGGFVRIVWPGCSRTFPSTCVGVP